MIITRTPFRISFFGGGTDLQPYCNEHGGAVLSTTIDKYLYITCRHMPPYWDYNHQLIYGSRNERVKDVDEIEHPSIRETMKYLNVDYGLDLHYDTDIPARSGMGSSSAFTVGLLNALYGLEGKMVSKRKLAAEAIHIEQDLIGEAVGCQDQIAAAFGGLNYITFKRGGGFFVSPVTISRARISELESHLVLIFTGFQRFASDIEKDKISRLNSKVQELKAIAEITQKAFDILNSEQDIRAFGYLMDEAWQLKKTLSEKVSTNEIDNLYKIGMASGAIGGKLLGAGGGGFMLFFCEPSKRDQLLEATNEYLSIPFSFERNGSQVIYYREEQPFG